MIFSEENNEIKISAMYQCRVQYTLKNYQVCKETENSNNQGKIQAIEREFDMGTQK